MMLIDLSVWTDQSDFNKDLHGVRQEVLPRVEFVKELVLNLMSECDELLRTTDWKAHRRVKVRTNDQHTLEELIDIFKLWLTLIQGLGYTQEQVKDAYWRKSMVVRQRLSEEWIRSIKPSERIVLVDIDGVLCDYVRGVLSFLKKSTPLVPKRIAELEVNLPHWVDNRVVGLPPETWEDVKHRLRTSGFKRAMPPMPESIQFTRRLRTAGFTIVLLTSRPIDSYPTIYSDTLQWLHNHEFEFDTIWWATNKADAVVIREVREQVAFAVDDDINFVAQLDRLGIRAYHFAPRLDGPKFSAFETKSFTEILERENL